VKKLLLATVVAAGVATGAQANEFDVSGYLQGSVGHVKSKDVFKEEADFIKDNAGSVTSDRTRAGYKLLVGLQLNQYIALEAQYIELGKTKFNAGIANGGAKGSLAFDAKTNGFGANLVGNLPVTDNFSVFVKGGIHSLKTSVSGSGAVSGTGTDWDGTYSGKDSTTKMSKSFGGGVVIGLNDNLDLIGEYESYRKVAKVKGYHIDMTSMGIRYKF